MKDMENLFKVCHTIELSIHGQPFLKPLFTIIENLY